MNRFAQAALTDEELQKYIDRFAAAAKLLKVDEVKLENKTPEDGGILSLMPEVQLSLRLGDKWLGTVLDWMLVEDMRANKFHNVSKIAFTMARMLHDGAGAPIDKFGTVSRFAGVVGELEFDKEKP